MEVGQSQVTLHEDASSNFISNINMLTEIAKENIKLDDMIKEEHYKDYQFDIITQIDLASIPINPNGQIIDKQASQKQSLMQVNVRMKEILLSNYLRATDKTKSYCTKYGFDDSDGTEGSSEDNMPTIPKDNMIRQNQAMNTSSYHLLSEIYQLREENKALNQQLKVLQITPETMQDDKKVKCYTGLPNFATLMTVYRYLIPDDTLHRNCTIDAFQRFMLIMLKLRLNLTTEDLAFRFGSTATTISKAFSVSLDMFYIKLKPFIIWPSRQQRSLTMPTEFKRYFGCKITVIIDCFELFIEKPSNLLAKAKTWSSYKMHNTVKYLIGVTPQGTISFISQGWGGRVSDKYITENCGILDKLLPGDIILADQGFKISESVGAKGAIALTSGSIKNNRQLSAFDIERTRKIAHIRIHVERMIGLMRLKYRILQSTLPLAYFCTPTKVPIVDKLVTVCCALINLCPSIVPNN